ncbi:MAG TPA: alpha/beta fold hydrolase [Gaiellaceae bacterium]|nr:alpha/beta fold hydrolase [Gaiellaceae bacterium]
MTLVLVGSLGSTRQMWEPQAPLGPARAFELPGHGDEPVYDGVSVDRIAERVLAAVDGPFSVVGLSLGGAVAMRIAAEAPQRVEKVVLACTSPDFGDAAQWLERAATVRDDGLETIVDAVLGRWFSPAYPDVARWREMFLSVDPEGYGRCCAALAGWDGRDDLRRIEAPTLVLAGAGDPTSPPAHAEEIASLVPGARVAVIDGAQHLANVERAGEFNRLVKEHL